MLEGTRDEQDAIPPKPGERDRVWEQRYASGWSVEITTCARRIKRDAVHAMQAIAPVI